MSNPLRIAPLSADQTKSRGGRGQHVPRLDAGRLIADVDQLDLGAPRRRIGREGRLVSDEGAVIGHFDRRQLTQHVGNLPSRLVEASPPLLQGLDTLHLPPVLKLGMTAAHPCQLLGSRQAGRIAPERIADAEDGLIVRKAGRRNGSEIDDVDLESEPGDHPGELAHLPEEPMPMHERVVVLGRDAHGMKGNQHRPPARAVRTELDAVW